MSADHNAVEAVKQRFTRWVGHPEPMKPFQPHWCDVDAMAAHVVALEGPQLQQRVTQTRLHSETVNGNCLAACLASVFGGACEDYHDRIALNDGWWSDVEKIFAERGYLVLRLSPADGKPSGLSFAAGDSPRGIRHLCVAMDGEVVHDPHPSHAGLVEITDYWVMVPWRFDAITQAAA